MKEKEQRLRELREENNLTQKHVAKILNVTRVTYSRYENGQRAVPLDVFWKLADYYKVNIDYLVGREE